MIDDIDGKILAQALCDSENQPHQWMDAPGLLDRPRIVYVGQLRWRYRWAEVWKALGVVWNALRGYYQTVEWTDDAPDISV